MSDQNIIDQNSQTDTINSSGSNFLMAAANIIEKNAPMPIYYTPQKLADKIILHSIIQNPSYDEAKL